MKALAFSKDRALQCDGMLRSLAMHAKDPVDVTVLWKATTDRHLNSYDQLIRLHPNVTFEHEASFEYQVRKFLADAGEHVLFLVDDTIFVREWSPGFVEVEIGSVAHAERCRAKPDYHRWAHIQEPLDNPYNAIGFSLRLGCNTTHCYPTGTEQPIPDASHGTYGDRDWDWTKANGDFGYPLEVSSSVYRTQTIVSAIEGLTFTNPSTMEVALASRAWMFAQSRPKLMAYWQSVAFSNPCNKVQDIFANRAGTSEASTPDALLEQWQRGMRMNVDAYSGFVPNGAHQEVSIALERRT